MNAPASNHSSLAGMTLAAAAFALLTSVDTIFKLLAEHHPAWQILFINAFFALIPTLTWGMLTGGFSRFRTARPVQHFVRGSASVLSAFAAIYAYSRLPLADYYAIVFAGPLIVTAMSAFWLGEKVDNARWLAIAVGFAGVVLVTNPFGDNGEPHGAGVLMGRFAALISVFCYAISAVLIRRMRLGETNMAFVLYGYIACVLISGPLLWLHGGAPLQLNDILHLALSGTLAGMASICLMTAYHRSPVALVAPFQYTQILWGAIAGYIFWNHLPDAHLVIGAVVVAGSGLFVIYREMRARDIA